MAGVRRSMLAALTLSLSVLTACSAKAAPEPVPASWPLPKDASAAAAQAKLPMLAGEVLTVHYHSHVDIVLRGSTVKIPAGIGIDTARSKISPLHTHDSTGIVHIESGQDVPFTLGQLFAEWGQPLSSRQVGTVAAEDNERVLVIRNGEVLSGDPAAVRFTAHAEIVIWLGGSSATPQVNSSYTFPPNY
jgi:hypothetical protein